MAQEYWIKILDFGQDDIAALQELGFEQQGGEALIEDIYFRHWLCDFRKAGWQVRWRKIVEAGKPDLVEGTIKSPPNKEGVREVISPGPTQFASFRFGIILASLVGLRIHTRRQKNAASLLRVK